MRLRAIQCELGVGHARQLLERANCRNCRRVMENSDLLVIGVCVASVLAVPASLLICWWRRWQRLRHTAALLAEARRQAEAEAKKQSALKSVPEFHPLNGAARTWFAELRAEAGDDLEVRSTCITHSFHIF